MSSKFYPGCFQLYPFLSDRRITVDIARAGYAKATYECLPCELRDLVYAYLWATIYITMTAPPSFKSINENLDMAITRVRHLGFGAPKILGYEVALEAFQWLYEYGILGYKIPLHTLGHYLATRKNSGRVVPAECRLRSINVMNEWRMPGLSEPMKLVPSNMWEQTNDKIADKITDNFTPLLQLDLVAGCQLMVHIVVTYTNGKLYSTIYLLSISALKK
jgi:hypothetical protein